tara:strand:+ start:15381 stop:15821 length:441 start_codon:yes stop_codon:yes gene_type:complete
MDKVPRIITTEEVMFFDTDVGGVVHNIAYLRMIETARTRLAAQMGMKLVEMADRQEYPVVVRTEIDYRKPARLGDVIEIRGELESLERVRFWMRFEVVRPTDEALLITCRQQLALVQMPKGRPLRIPREWTELYQGAQSLSDSNEN